MRLSSRFGPVPRVALLAVAAVVIALIAQNIGRDDDRTRDIEAQLDPAELASQRWFRDACDVSLPLLQRIRRGHHPDRSPDVAFIQRQPHYFEGFAHAGPWPYLQRVPFAFYGPGILESTGSVTPTEEVTMADLAPTVAELIDAEMPTGRPGRPVVEVVDAVEAGAEVPRLVVTAVLDGGGWNALQRWPDRWPFIKELMQGGVSITNATVGSSPSVTPPIHATLGTGTFPDEHGIVDIPVRDGDRVEDSWENDDPSNLRVSTLADEYDLATGNEATIGMIGETRWHLGMIGHGAAYEGGDRDIAVVSDLEEPDGTMYANEEFYALPNYVEDKQLFADLLEETDLRDGADDGMWRGRDLSDPLVQRFTPVWTLYQRVQIAQVIPNEGFGADDVADLLFINYKFIDHAGHKYTVDAPEMGIAVEMTDRSVRDLVRVLDEHVGRGQWVLALTADHGVQPERPRGRLIRQNPLSALIEARFGAEIGRLVLEDRALGIWVDRSYAAELGVGVEEIARYINGFTIGDDLRDDEELKPFWSPDDRLFEAAFPTKYLDEIWECATESR